MGEGKLNPLTIPSPVKRQLRNIAHVITSTISPHKPNFVKIAPGVTSPHIAKVTTQFFLNFFVRKIFYRPRAQSVEPILTCDTSADAYSRRVVLLGVRRQYFHIFTLKTHKTPFLGTYNGKPIQNTYSHNYMIHRDTMLKFGTLFGLTKYFEHTQYIFSIRSTAGG